MDLLIHADSVPRTDRQLPGNSPAMRHVLASMNRMVGMLPSGRDFPGVAEQCPLYYLPRSVVVIAQR